MNKTHFTHDCRVCRFIDSFVHVGTTLDLYLHDYEPVPVFSIVILRYGDAEGEYYGLLLESVLKAEDGKWQRAAQLLKEPKNV